MVDVIEMKEKENCGICGAPLEYRTDPVSLDCEYCGKRCDALVCCPSGHYVCDTCHKGKSMDIARKLLKASASKDPLELFEKIVAHPSVSMHGPEHHAIVAAVLVAAARNSDPSIPFKAVQSALDRGEKVPGGWCGFYGACGAAIGVGVAVSVLTRATPLTGETRTLALKATAAALDGMADGDPRCCKRAGRKSIEAAVEYLDRNLGIVLSKGKGIKCRYSHRNRECPKGLCSYFDNSPL
jgi:hypothetical protein